MRHSSIPLRGSGSGSGSEETVKAAFSLDHLSPDCASAVVLQGLPRFPPEEVGTPPTINRDSKDAASVLATSETATAAVAVDTQRANKLLKTEGQSDVHRSGGGRDGGDGDGGDGDDGDDDRRRKMRTPDVIRPPCEESGTSLLIVGPDEPAGV